MRTAGQLELMSWVRASSCSENCRFAAWRSLEAVELYERQRDRARSNAERTNSPSI